MLKKVRCYVQFRSGNQTVAKLNWRLPFPLGSNCSVEGGGVHHGQLPISPKTLHRPVPWKANIVSVLLYSIEIWSIYSRHERRPSAFHLRCQIRIVAGYQLVRPRYERRRSYPSHVTQLIRLSSAAPSLLGWI